MERVYAFTDEYGAFGWDLINPSVSTHFIITSIIVNESEKEYLSDQIEKIRAKHFQTGELKSLKIANNHNRRNRIIHDISQLPFSIFSVVIEKKNLMDNSGLRHKQVFYKFLNNIIHIELRNAFKLLTIVADEFGSGEYMKSFSKYVEKKQDIPSLLGDANFLFENSKTEVLIQLADFISGTLAYKYDDHKKKCDPPDFIRMLEKKIIRIELFPKTYETFIFKNKAFDSLLDKDIAELCFKLAVTFIEKNSKVKDLDIIAQIIVLKYLLFKIMSSNGRNYVSTNEIMQQLYYSKIGKISEQSFRTNIVGNLRDNNVIIASSSRGYKLPSNQAELYDFINHGTSIINPMLERIRTCRNLIKLGTNNRLDLFEHTENSTLKKLLNDN